MSDKNKSCFWGHIWSKWEQYDFNGTAIPKRGEIAGKSFPIFQRRQKRRCSVCDFEQDEEVTRS